MRAKPGFAIGLLFLLSFSTISFAREAPTIAAVTAGEKVRFTAPGGVCQMRVQVLSASGEPLSDSAWSDGNVLDLPVGQESHRFLVMTKDLDGHVSQSELSIDGVNEGNPKVTLLAHDGQNGAIVSTSGDLSFRFGDFLAGKDSERMRLTADGILEVHGIMFPDGTVLTTASSSTAPASTPPISRQQPVRSAIAGGLGNQKLIPATNAGHLKPRPDFTPGFQFVVGNSGVNIGTTNPAYTLDVTGTINTASSYSIGGTPFVRFGGNNNSFFGPNAGTIPISAGDNTALGAYTLTSETTGNSNTALGAKSLQGNTTGNGNTGAGAYALQLNTTGSGNTATGFNALYNNDDGANNTVTGNSALYSNTSGFQNTAIGYGALYSNGTGAKNTAVGFLALYSSSNSFGNIAIGESAGYDTIGSNNIDIGNRGAAETSTIRIGTAAAQTRAFVAGINGVTTAGAAVPVVIDASGQLGTASSSRRYKFDIADMDRVTDGLMDLRPVTFRYQAHGANAPLQYGLIAEEVAEIYPEMVTRNKDGEVEAVMYQFLAPMLLNEVQKQRKTIETLERRLEALENHQRGSDCSSFSAAAASTGFEKR